MLIDAFILIWIIPLAAIFGFLIAALMFSAAEEGNNKR